MNTGTPERLCFKYVAPDDRDFLSLVKELNKSLTSITNDSGESSFKAEAFNSEKDGYLVGYLNGEPTVCGGFRYHSESACEIKRMYSAKPGLGSLLLSELESYALSKGYRSALLSTRRVNTKAVSFYEKHGYHNMPAYGRYVGREVSVCLGKKL